ncbi:MAG: lytic transglycosylase domain-containing protein [Saprospiraceae bacterium]|nr:lytic transglycosylase domain-containing protein [Saprospiraceae bacterium]
MKKNAALVLVGLIIGASILIASTMKPSEEESAYATYNEALSGPTYYSVKVPNYIDFAGERVPTEIDDVKERLERELLVTAYRHSNTFLMLKRKARWFPVIEQILREEGVPDDFKYLCVAESALANAVSPAGAKGFWQFLSRTGKEYGLEVNDVVDERYHVEKSTRAACKYLKQSKARFGSWTAAAASYNMGSAGLNRQMERQKERDYYDLLLNDETSRYVFRILAFKEVLNHPANYGFIIDYNDQYQPYVYSEVIVDSNVDSFADFAQQFNTNYKTLKKLNPWLRDSYLKVPAGKTYTVKIPL